MPDPGRRALGTKPPSAAVDPSGCSCGFQLPQSLDFGAVQWAEAGNRNSRCSAWGRVQIPTSGAVTSLEGEWNGPSMQFSFAF